MDQALINMIIQWGPTILLLVNVVLAVVFGLLRGFRKNLILAIQALVIFCICIIVFFVLVNAESFNSSLYGLINMASTTFTGQSINATLGVSGQANTVKDLILEVILLNNADEGMASIITMITKDSGAYLLALVNGAYRLILALVLSILYALLVFIFYLIYLIAYPERRHKNKVQENYALQKKTKPYKKRRALGAVIGGVRGLITSIFLLSIVGSLLYIVSGDTQTQEADFGNNEINGYYDMYASVSDYDEYGVYKILSQLKDKDNVPYYLYIADTILSGKATDINSAGEQVTASFVLREEFTNYTKFTKRTLNLVLKYANEELKTFINNPNENTTNQFMIALADLFSDKAFNDEFKAIVADFNDSFILNFALSGIDAFASNLDLFANEATTEDDFAIGLMKVVFTGQNRIKVSQILTKDDAVSVFNAIIDVLANIDYSFDDSMALYVNPLENLVDTSQILVDCLCNLSLFNDPDKASKFNLMLSDVFTYLSESWVVTETPEEDITPLSTVCDLSNTTIADVNWANEVKNLLQMIPSGIVLYNSISASISPSDPDNENNPDVMIDAVFELFTGDNQVENNKAYDNIVNILSNSQIIGTLLTFDPIYDLMFGALEESTGSHIVMPDITYANTVDSEGNVISYGETYNILSSFKLMLNEEGKEVYLQLMKMSDLNDPAPMGTTVKNTLNFLAKKDASGNSVVTGLAQSKLLLGLLSHYIGTFTFDMDGASYGIYLLSDTYDEITDSTGATGKLIKSSSLVDVIEGIIPLVEAFEETLNTGLEDVEVTSLLTQDNLTKIADVIEKSQIVEATLANIFIGALTSNEMITLPRELMTPEGWVNQGEESGEIVKIINVFIDLNIDVNSLLNLDINYVLNDILTEDNTAKLFSSDVLYLSVSSLISNYEALDSEGNTTFAVIVPKSSMVETKYTDTLNQKLYAIDRNEIIDTVNTIKQIANIGENEVSINYNNIFKKVNGEYTVLSTDVMYATLVFVVSNTLETITMEGSDDPIIVIPEVLANAGSKDALVNNASYQNNFENNPWKQSNELAHLLDSIDILLEVSTTENFDFSDTTALTNKLTSNITKLTEKVNEESETTKLDVVYNSQVIKSTLTESLPTFAPIVVIPSDAKGTDGYITKAELTNLFEIMNDIIPEDGGIEDISFDGLVITQSLRTKIVNSTIMAATLTNYLKVSDTTQDGDIQNMIVVPVTQTSLVNGHLSKAELTSLFDSLDILVGDAEHNIKISDLSSLDAKTLIDLDDEGINTITSSEVISYSLTSILSTTELSDGASIIVPKTVLTSSDIEDINGNNVQAITNDQLKGLITNLKEIVKEDGDSLSVDITSVFKQKDSILANDVLHATIISFFVTTFDDGETIVIPDSLKIDGIKSNLIDNFSTTNWVTNAELNNLMTGLDLVLEISTSETEFTFDNSVSTKLMSGLLTVNDKAYPTDENNNDTKLNILYRSEIMRKTLTDTLPSKVDMIVMPLDAIGTDGYVKESELKSLFDLAPNLVKEGETLENASADNLLLNTANKDIIVSSNIILATITKYLTATDSSSSAPSMVIPNIETVYDSTNEHITNAEMDKLLSTMITIFGAGSKITEVEFSLAKLKDLDDTDIAAMNDSEIMRYTITDFLRSENQALTVIIPNQILVDNSTDINGTAISAADKNELNGVIKTITSIIPEDDPSTSVDESANIDIKTVFEKKDDIVANNILHPTVINYMLQEMGETVIIPAALRTAGSVDNLTSNFANNLWNTSHELSNLFDALDVLFNISGSTNFSFDSIDVENSLVGMNSPIGEGTTTKLDVTYSSLIIQSTFTDTLSNNNNVKVPGGAYALNSQINELVIHQDELKNLFDLLGNSTISNISADTIDLNSILSILEGEHATILRTIVSDGILDNLGESSTEASTIRSEVSRYDSAINLVPTNTIGVTNTELQVLTYAEINGIVSGIKTILGVAEGEALLVSSIDVSNISLSSTGVRSIMEGSQTLSRVISRSIIGTVDAILKDCFDNTDGETPIQASSPMYNKYLKAEDVIQLFVALETVTNSSEISVDSIDVTSLKITSTNIDTLLTSRLAYVLISNELASNNTLAPRGINGIWDQDIKESDDIDVITTTEIKNLFSSIFAVLGVTEISLNDSLDVSNGSISTTNIDTILGSFIIWNKITETISDKISIPTKGYEDETVSLQNSFIAKNEVVSIINIIGTGDAGEKKLSLSASFSFNSLTADNITPMADSYIIRYEMSKQIIANSTGTNPSIYIPSSQIENESSNTDTTENYITKTEFTNLLKALLALNVTNISSFSISVPDAESDLTTMFNSMIIRATMTNLLDVKDYTEYFVESDLDMNSEMLVLNSTELTNIINAINALSNGGSSAFELTLDFNTILGLSETQRNTLLTSNTIRIAVSNILVDAIGNNIVLQNFSTYIFDGTTLVPTSVYYYNDNNEIINNDSLEVYSKEDIETIVTRVNYYLSLPVFPGN